MSTAAMGKLLPAAAAAAGIAALASWLATAGPAVELRLREPGADNRPATAGVPPVLDIAKAGKLEVLGPAPAEVPGAWPRFRGSDFSNVSREGIALARTWPEGGPKSLWQIDLGEGHAGAVVLHGRVYVLDYDRQGQADVMRCLSLADGKDVWRFRYPVRVKRNHGMSRTVPAVTEKVVVGLGPKNHVICLDATSGKLLWAIDLVKAYGATVPTWYAGQCPMIDRGRAILAPGGPEALMMAVDCATGKVVWTTPNPRGWGMTHSSIMPMAVAGRDTYVYCATGGVVGVSAEDGKVLWEYPDWKIRIANIASPVIVGDGRVFLAGGYNAGSLMLKVAADGDRLAAEPLYRLKHQVFSSHQQTPVLHGGYLYGVRQDGQLVCLGLDGKVRWTSGSSRKFGLGPYMIADGLILILDDHGLLSAVEANPQAYRQLAQAKVLPGPDAWAPMALAGGRLILRDLKKMVCLDLRAP